MTDMFERDYIMNLLVHFAAAIRRSMEQDEKEHDPDEAARMLDLAVGDAVDLDSDMLLNLAPDSAAGLLQVSGTDPQVTEYIARSLLLSSSYYAKAGEGSLADLRATQAHAIAEAYGHDLPDGEMSCDDMEDFLDAQQSSDSDLPTQ